MFTVTDEDKELFKKIKINHGIDTKSSEEICDIATEQWLKTHDCLPSIDEIDDVIKEVRDEKNG